LEELLETLPPTGRMFGSMTLFAQILKIAKAKWIETYRDFVIESSAIYFAILRRTLSHADV
jgi:hypothetical protein